MSKCVCGNEMPSSSRLRKWCSGYCPKRLEKNRAYAMEYNKKKILNKQWAIVYMKKDES